MDKILSEKVDEINIVKNITDYLYLSETFDKVIKELKQKNKLKELINDDVSVYKRNKKLIYYYNNTDYIKEYEKAYEFSLLIFNKRYKSKNYKRIRYRDTYEYKFYKDGLGYKVKKKDTICGNCNIINDCCCE